MQCGPLHLECLSLVGREDVIIVHILVATGPRHPTGAIGYADPHVCRILKQPLVEPVIADMLGQLHQTIRAFAHCCGGYAVDGKP